MAVPPFDRFWLPFLQVLKDQGRTSLSEMKVALQERLGLSNDDVRELLPSGRQRRYDNRIGWARTYLSKAGLITTVERGVYELTPAGQQLLAQNPTTLEHDDLRSYEPFRNWEEASRAGTKTDATGDAAPAEAASATDGETPEETIAEAFRVLTENLASDVLDTLHTVTWQRFEDIVIDVLLALGYGGSRSDAGRAFKASGDGGVDGVIDEDRLGLSKIYVQAKRYAPDRKISRPDVQAFVGSLLGVKSRQGIYITTSSFPSDARDYATTLSDFRAILIDGRTLAHYMVEHDVGVTPHDTYTLKRLDTDYYNDT
jgi:restriction system protein